MKIIDFLKAAIRDPRIGAVMPSSRYAADAVMAKIPAGLRRVLEYGPGDGVFTRRLLDLLPSDGKLVAVETNTTFLELLRDIDDPRFRLVDGDATAAERLVREDERPFDLVISGIPFSMLTREQRSATVDMTHALLRDGGTFLVYQTSPLMLPYLKKRFDVRTTVALRNVPPYVIMAATKRG